MSEKLKITQKIDSKGEHTKKKSFFKRQIQTNSTSFPEHLSEWDIYS